MKVTLDRGIRLLIVANLLLVGTFAAVLLVNIFGSDVRGHPVQAADASGSPETMQMGLAHIPTSNACVLCHESGGSAGLKTVPAVGHPIDGWSRCVVCHTNEKLGAKAPGHEGIQESECLNCHKAAPSGPPITQPHSRFQDQQCLDCHGSYAHLPSSMVGRDPKECWLCHKPTASPPPQYPHPANIPQSCRSCHLAGQAGNLPIDHALRADNTCLLCHDIKTAGSPPPSLRPVLPASAPPGATPSPSP
jgi:hypothetical protein